MRVTVGLYLESEPWRLDATLESLRPDLDDGVGLLLLPDGPDAAMSRALAELRHLPSSATAEARGMAACFNRLARHDDAELVVLLEAGCQVSPGWLRQLRAALAADASHGLAGPSTNRSWNQQAAFRGTAGRAAELVDPAELARMAATAERRFGPAFRTLEPLHSLADFCYAVRRQVIDAVGAADEGYGPGPCWEMDYNLRAARAGFRGVWAGAAYVHRPPFTARRRRYEAQRMEAARRRYQDHFCALKLRGERDGYKPHCRGEECEHFAPRELIRIRRPFAEPAPTEPAPTEPAAIEPAPAEPAETPRPAIEVDDRPLVSCIMPTAGRPDFVLQSLRYFERQGYPHRELIIVDDGAGGGELARRLPEDPRVRYLQPSGRPTIGAKRNLAVAQARGEILVHWDDDDWYAPDRLSAQIAPILAGDADVTALATGVVFDLDRWTFWRCTPALHRRMFVGDVHGGTLAYRRRLAEQTRYPNRSLAEDAVFLRRALARGARLRRLDNADRFIYLRHGTNSWAFPCGRFLDPGGWREVGEPALPPDDRAFYAARSPAGPSSPPFPGGEPESADEPGPLVSCIMPTADRPGFVAQAAGYFLRQSYPHRELIVVDDGAEPVAELLPEDSRIRYLRPSGRRRIGAKRNLACEEARGDVIVHWDDDDWSGPDRLAVQVAALGQGRADVCGLDRVLFYDPHQRRSWRYTYRASGSWVYGATLCYRKSFWRRHPFPDVQIGEDNRFVRRCVPERLAPHDDDGFFVALVHTGNTSAKRVRGSCWRETPLHQVERRLADDLPFYRSLRQEM